MENISLMQNASYVNGNWEKGSDTKVPVYNPADVSMVGEIYDAGDDLLNCAVDAANEAFPSWKAKTAKERASLLRRWYELMIENKEELAKIMTLESGKAIKESRGEVEYAASFFEWFAEEGKRAYGDLIPPVSSNKRIVVTKQPVGVVAALTPWNFPLAMITRKIAPALAVGCTVVVRPSIETPFSALALAKLAEKAGFDKGVVNIVVTKSASRSGEILSKHDKINKISFTGSTKIGQLLSEQSVSTLKRVSLELGGNAPFIVFDDADLKAAVAGGITSKFRNSGQTCVCVNRFYVCEKIYDQFCEAFTKSVEQLKVGNGLDEETDLGPLINQKAVEKMKLFVEDAQSKGGKITTGGHVLEGNFFAPTVITHATQNMLFAQEEIFGPTAAIFKFSTEEEAIEAANNTIYGLASYFYTKDISRAWRVAEALEYRMVGINDGLISTEVAPFGGVKYSGQGREGSKYGIEDYLEIKYMSFGNI